MYIYTYIHIHIHIYIYIHIHIHRYSWHLANLLQNNYNLFTGNCQVRF